MYSQPRCLVFIAFCGLSFSAVTFGLQGPPVGENKQTPEGKNARNSPMETDNGDGPTRKKSRLEESSTSKQFPTTLEGFGYKFNEKGELRHITTGERYVFEVEKGNAAYNQKRYEALGKVIIQHVYKLLETETNLKRIHIPLETSKGEPRSFVFVSENALRTRDKLLVLINGSGAVRAGQWARSLIINDCLDSGTQIPYIKRAQEAGYEVLVLNTNENRGLNAKGDSVTIRGSSTPNEHAVYAWDNFVAKRPVKRVAIVAHSMGGSVTAHIAQKREQSFLKKVFAIAFTDSVHSLSVPGVSRSIKELFAKHSVNWVSSSKPLDTPIPLPRTSGPDSRRASAGTKVHAETSWTSIASVFTFLKDQEDEVLAADGDRSSQSRDKPAASLALSEEYDVGDDDDDDDSDKTLELKDVEDSEEGGDRAKKDSQSQESTTSSVNAAGSAGIDISSSEEETEASFDFTRYSEEL